MIFPTNSDQYPEQGIRDGSQRRVSSSLAYDLGLCCFIGAEKRNFFVWTGQASDTIRPWERNCLSSSCVSVINSIMPVHITEKFYLGEGFHNYHHIFPQDYATSEFGLKLNPSKAFIDLMAFLGLAYDLKTASKSHIDARKKRSGNTQIFQ